ncbi:DNA helicase Rep [Leucothrix pacifica]|uniref:ATP-dependent DNA helicase Rep n=1 Tax=Leucothrix pacifica TaxID=1247513 RepID=A0A317C1W0_9GAMM|nr:DNA helicase Rep [Leucothrix pacifica]PWQ92538.1 DNA helicase Rep [Leucothrix pacifica]
MFGLNPQQQAAVEHIGSPLLVLAGAGSGKTRVITEKIAWLIREAKVPAKHIAAITFTNKASREMKERASQLLSKEEAKGLTVATFHNLGLQIIRREYKSLGYKSGFSILDAQDTSTIIKELMMRDEDAKEPDDDPRWIISRWKNDFISPKKALEQAMTPDELLAAKVYERYQRQLKAYNALDFDDLIVLPVQLFDANPEILAKWQNKLRYMLVDEYQDTNNCQYRMVRQLAGVRAELTVVGDDDQSIYAWRGARPENINQLQTDYPNLKLVKLEQNYRSTSSILDSANHLIANNPHLFEKKLWSALGSGDKIRVIPCRTAEHEIERVIGEIMKYHFRDRTEHRDFAILYRSNHQSRLFERYLRQNNIPYKISGGTSFFSRAEVKDTLAYIRLISNPSDDAAFLRVINTPKREIGATTLEKLGDYANEREVSLFAASTEMGLASQLTERGRSRLAMFCQWINDISYASREMDPHQVVEKVISDVDYYEWMQTTSSSPKMAERRMENVQEIIDWIKRLHNEGEGKHQDLGDIVAHMSLMDILERNQEDEDEDAVSLMTLHTSKGLEFPYVFLVGMEEDILPHANSLEDNGLEEERRLAYVGLTRAQKHLTITFAKTRNKFGEKVTCEPSRFLDELPEEHIEWEDRVVVSREQQQETAKSFINNLQDMLDD